MSWGQIALAIAAAMLLALWARDEAEINALEDRIAVLERRTAPLDRICAGTEDDFYEAFFRLVQEECEKK